MKPVKAHGNVTRQANKKMRRERIFNIAKQLIAHKGLDEFTISELAEEAGVSTPTIHNLFGKKEDIADELVAELILSLQAAMAFKPINDPVASAEIYVDSIVSMYKGKEDFYRSAYMAAEKTGVFEDRESIDSFYKQSIKIADQCVTPALEEGFLLGNISKEILTRQLYQCHRIGRQDWVYGYIDLDQYHKQVLEAMLMAYATDASPECHKRISKKLKSI
ncbi:TetR/AcrR family transcriptional regulator [Gammaproteobacteria bacterium]|nr:TetR/AcrR family transcriptional regulator [Gammaproteobacteria bacterium]